MKEGEGTNQRIHMHNPWTQTTAGRWPERRWGWVEVGKGGGAGDEDICNSVNNKNKEK